MGEVKLIFFILNPQNETLPPSLCLFQLSPLKRTHLYFV